MNQKLVKSLVQIIQSLSDQERQMLEEQLFIDTTNQVTTQDLMNLAQKSHSFNFLNDEPNLYTLEDGEPI